jgi:hypothetical protein
MQQQPPINKLKQVMMNNNAFALLLLYKCKPVPHNVTACSQSTQLAAE